MKTAEEIAEQIYHRRTQMNALDAKDKDLIEYFAYLIKDYSDQQNKELREEKERLKGIHDRTIKRLGLTMDHQTKVIDEYYEELTRLRELLAMAKYCLIDFASLDAGCSMPEDDLKKVQQILTKIDNALNHKP